MSHAEAGDDAREDHRCKVLSPYFDYMVASRKPWDLRYEGDRPKPFLIGQMVRFVEIDGDGNPSGRWIRGEITYVLRGPFPASPPGPLGLVGGWVIMTYTRDSARLTVDGTDLP